MLPYNIYFTSIYTLPPHQLPSLSSVSAAGKSALAYCSCSRWVHIHAASRRCTAYSSDCLSDQTAGHDATAGDVLDSLEAGDNTLVVAAVVPSAPVGSMHSLECCARRGRIAALQYGANVEAMAKGSCMPSPAGSCAVEWHVEMSMRKIVLYPRVGRHGCNSYPGQCKVKRQGSRTDPADALARELPHTC